jgi:hypothetical protein
MKIKKILKLLNIKEDSDDEKISQNAKNYLKRLLGGNPSTNKSELDFSKYGNKISGINPENMDISKNQSSQSGSGQSGQSGEEGKKGNEQKSGQSGKSGSEQKSGEEGSEQKSGEEGSEQKSGEGSEESESGQSGQSGEESSKHKSGESPSSKRKSRADLEKADVDSLSINETKRLLEQKYRKYKGLQKNPDAHKDALSKLEDDLNKIKEKLGSERYNKEIKALEKRVSDETTEITPENSEEYSQSFSPTGADETLLDAKNTNLNKNKAKVDFYVQKIIKSLKDIITEHGALFGDDEEPSNRLKAKRLVYQDSTKDWKFSQLRSSPTDIHPLVIFLDYSPSSIETSSLIKLAIDQVMNEYPDKILLVKHDNGYNIRLSYGTTNFPQLGKLSDLAKKNKVNEFWAVLAKCKFKAAIAFGDRDADFALSIYKKINKNIVSLEHVVTRTTAAFKFFTDEGIWRMGGITNIAGVSYAIEKLKQSFNTKFK